MFKNIPYASPPVGDDVMREFTNGSQKTVKNLDRERVDYQMKSIKTLYQMQ